LIACLLTVLPHFSTLQVMKAGSRPDPSHRVEGSGSKTKLEVRNKANDHYHANTNS